MITDTYILLNYFSKELYNKDLAYIDQQGYFLVDRRGSELTLRSLDGTTTLFPEQEKDFPTVIFLSDRKSLSQHSRNVVGTMSEHSRNTVATLSENVGEITKSQKALSEKYNIVDFSEKLLGTQKQLAKLTYKLILESFEKAERQKKSKQKIIKEYYNPALLAVSDKNIVELENIKDELLKFLGKQERALEARQVQKASEKIWKHTKKRLRLLTAIIVFTVLFFGAIILSRPHSDTSGQTSEKQKTETIITEKNFDQIIILYEKNTGQKVYEWRQKEIKKRLPAPQSKVVEMCNQNYTFK